MRPTQNNGGTHRPLNPLLAMVPLANATLSLRETEVLVLMCKEYSTKQIAHELSISSETVNTHKKSLRRKTGSLTEVGVVIFAVKNNLFLFIMIFTLC